LILGAGLRALKLSTSMVCPKKSDQSFPLLYTIPEEDETLETADVSEAKIVEVFKNTSVTSKEEVDPDNAEEALPQPGWEWDNEEEDVHCEDLGIGWTLKKVGKISAIVLPRGGS
jgi:hypothetical protein